VVSGRLVGQTQTLTLLVEERFDNFDQPAAFAAATVLALLAVITLLLIKLLRPGGAAPSGPERSGGRTARQSAALDGRDAE
jgi:sulfate/thiosulfate transport system permease protein